METLGSALTTVQWALLLLLLATAVGWGLRRVLVHRRRLMMIGKIEALADSGVMGLEVKPGGLEERAALTLVAGDAPANAAAIRLDTAAESESPAELGPLHLGVRALDARFVLRAADDGARRGMEAARSGALKVVGDFFDGSAFRLTRVSVADNSVYFAFGPGQIHRLEEMLPYLVWVAKALLSAAWWLPPSELTASSAFRGGPDVAPSAALWYLEVPGRVDRTGPFDLEQIVKLLQRGQISWLTRASKGAEGSLAPLRRHASLQSACFATTGGHKRDQPKAARSRSARRGRRLFDLLQLDFTLLLLLGAALIASCEAGDDLSRAALGEQSVRWPTAPAEIVESRVAVRRSGDDTYYWPAIRYRYRVEGRQLTGTRWRYRYVWRFGGYTGDRAEVEQAVARYGVGRKVRVAYDPDEPSESVLEPGLFRTELVSGLIKVCFMGVVVLLLISAAIARLFAFFARRRARAAICVDVSTV